MKKIHLVFSETKDGKHFAHAETIKTGENLKVFVDMYSDAKVIHICETAIQAAFLAEKWNEAYRNNGTYMFQEGEI